MKVGRRYGDRLRPAMIQVFQCHFQLITQCLIATLLLLTLLCRLLKHVAKNVLIGSSSCCCCSSTSILRQSFLAKSIVDGALLAIRQDIVGFCHFVKGTSIPAGLVGMRLHASLAIGFGDFSLRGRMGDSEDSVIILVLQDFFDNHGRLGGAFGLLRSLVLLVFAVLALCRRIIFVILLLLFLFGCLFLLFVAGFLVGLVIRRLVIVVVGGGG